MSLKVVSLAACASGGFLVGFYTLGLWQYGIVIAVLGLAGSIYSDIKV